MPPALRSPLAGSFGVIDATSAFEALDGLATPERREGSVEDSVECAINRVVEEHVTRRAAARNESAVARLVRNVVECRPGADRELVERFKVHAYRLLARALGPGPDVDDLLQEVFFRVFQKIHKVDPPEALPGFVTSIAVLVAREALRKRKRSKWLSFISIDDLADLAGSSGPDASREARARYELYDVLAKLPPHSQLCIALRYVEGMELEEMAHAMDVSLATAKRHLKRAEEEFAEVIGDDRFTLLERGTR